MMKLSDRNWEAFYISDEKENGIFKLRASMSGIDKNKLLDSKEPQIPYITRSDFNNGVSLFVGKEQKEKYQLDDGNVITIGLDTQTVFYQPHSFYTGQNIQVLYNENLNKYTAKFIIPLLKMQVSKLSWGGNGATLGRLKRMQLLLPVDDDNLPDYAFMETFIKEREAEKRKEYIDYCKKQLENMAVEDKVAPLANKQWKSFFIGEIFDYFVPGKSKGLNHLEEDMFSGKSYIGATNRNNGVLSFVQADKKMIQKGNTIGFIKNGNGSAGYAIYKYESFVSTSDVIFAYANWLNRYIGLFITTCSDMSQEKYSHGYKWTKERLLKSGIMLPVNEYGTPDYEYMEQYSKNIICKKIRDYLGYALVENHS
ncbi:TPA: restriction endonuclease subunit S [Clostridioides difficile]|uniref:restriction endonuclease subunit S n=1 Tax=Clostridioides difficile TaxID=1496 RepID=UPI0003B28576|nr:restriction endonuclease subunit S [Clostridioides difficile]EGT3756408.1 restriction endonuclease [Clostridioides difficile]EGT3781732.1 restriction endonuclease [Clostridioides difficile]EGT4160294.1 restriction endonuclease [Clostridioides difficile]EGT4634620.1 restriction endonuclease [Clostridioides difficile]EGT5074218.1 restriction endonuclease [Clostridioides difficile]